MNELVAARKRHGEGQRMSADAKDGDEAGLGLLPVWLCVLYLLYESENTRANASELILLAIVFGFFPSFCASRRRFPFLLLALGERLNLAQSLRLSRLFTSQSVSRLLSNRPHPLLREAKKAALVARRQRGSLPSSRHTGALCLPQQKGKSYSGLTLGPHYHMIVSRNTPSRCSARLPS